MNRQERSACVLLNPNAAGGRAAALEAPVRAWLDRLAPGVELLVCQNAQAARHALARRPANGRVVVIGGDGTLNQLLPTLLAGRHELGVVPFGSGNDVARALGLYRVPWGAALAHALTGPACPVDVGMARFASSDEAQTVPFLSSCTAGFDSSVGKRALLGPRWLTGLPRYLLATLRELAHLRNWRVQVQTDGVIFHTDWSLFASVLNTPTFGSGMPAVPHARIDDGHLDLLVAGRFDRVGTAAMLPRLLLGRHLSHPRVHTQTFAELELIVDEPIELATDGEYRGQSGHVRVSVQPGALPVVRGPVPEK